MSFVPGNHYTRKDVRHVLGLEPDKISGNWSTSYVKHEGAYCLFVTLSAHGSSKDPINEVWEQGYLKWESKSSHGYQSNTVQELIGGEFTIHLFVREDNNSLIFTYIGRAVCEAVAESKPVEVIWKIQ